jgi:methionyl-tRNA formyltransferase
MNKVAVIGAVSTTKITIEKLHEHGFEIVAVLGHEPLKPELVSGLEDLKTLSISLDLPYKGYQKINEPELMKWVKEKQPDYLFAVGFSQLLSKKWLSISRRGTIGFHPTKLPKGRGRAPIAWLVLDNTVGAANFFLMNENADDGPILSSFDFEVSEDDDATTLETKIKHASQQALDQWLPELKKGYWNPVKQDFSQATWYGKRSPVDGLIDWNLSANVIDRLVKASTKPHPGAYTFFDDGILIVWKGTIEKEIPIKGVPGRVLLIDEAKGLLVQTGTLPYWIKVFEHLDNSKNIMVGSMLGYNVQHEIYELKKLIQNFQKYD